MMRNKNTIQANKSIQSLFIVTVLLFWGLPFIKDLLPEKDAQEIIQACLLLVNPMFCLLMTYRYCQNNPFTWYLPFGLMLIFIPLPFLFYQWNDLFYVPMYGLATCLGYVISFLINKGKTKIK